MEYSNNVATICNYDHNMEIFLIEFGNNNEHHIEIWLLNFSFLPVLRATLKFWLPYGYMIQVENH